MPTFTSRAAAITYFVEQNRDWPMDFEAAWEEMPDFGNDPYDFFANITDFVNTIRA